MKIKYCTSIILIVLGFFFVSAHASDEKQIKQGELLNGEITYEVFSKIENGKEELYSRTSNVQNDTYAPPTKFDAYVKIRDYQFDPLEDLKNNSLNTSKKVSTANSISAYLVKLHTQPISAYSDEISLLGGKVVGFIPNQTYIVHCTSGTAEKIKNLDYVRSVSEYKSEYKTQHKTKTHINQRKLNDKKLTANATNIARRYIISLLAHQMADLWEFEEFLKSIHAELAIKASMKTGFPQAMLTDEQLQAVTEHVNVEAVDEWSPPQLDMSVVRQVSGANYVQEQVSSYTGLGVKGEVVDLGLMRHGSFKNLTTYGALALNEIEPAHGTSTYGIVFGDGTEDPALNSTVKAGKGLLPNAIGYFSSFNAAGYSRSKDLSDMTDPAGPYKILFQSNSWGSPYTTEYTIASKELDQIIYDHDVVVLQSQGNANSSLSLSRPEAWARNVVSIGGISGNHTANINDDKWDSGSSHGNATKDKIKPDLVHYSDGVLTSASFSKYAYGNFQGTSASTPIVAGHFGLMFQMWADGIFTGTLPSSSPISELFQRKPHASTARALIINTAQQYTFSDENSEFNRMNQGWGMPNVKTLFDLAKNNSWALPLVIDESVRLKQAEEVQYTIRVNQVGNAIKATMVYSDPPNSLSDIPTNNLDLRLISPSGTVYWGNFGLKKGVWSIAGGAGDTVNTVENVFIKTPELGNWKIIVSAARIYTDINITRKDSGFGLIVSCEGVATCNRPSTMVQPLAWLIPATSLMLLN